MRRSIAGVGRALITLGILILLFVAYQVWGTGVFTARAQEDLKDDFAALEQQYGNDDPVVGSTTTGPTTPTTATTTTTTTRPGPAPPPPAEGQVAGLISIPAIGMQDKAFVEGTSRDDLKKGPGHYLATPMPGQLGNAGIAGHRTTYGAPFNRIDELKVGDRITVKTIAGEYTYSVFEQLVVNPTDVWVVDPPPDPLSAWLTLTSCHPKGSASKRMVVRAKLVPAQSSAPQVAPPTTTDKPREHSLAEGLSGQKRSMGPATLWAIVVTVIGLAWWWAFRRWRHPLTWALGVIPFLLVLAPFYVYLGRALPAGY
jgi:sortase A